MQRCCPRWMAMAPRAHKQGRKSNIYENSPLIDGCKPPLLLRQSKRGCLSEKIILE